MTFFGKTYVFLDKLKTPKTAFFTFSCFFVIFTYTYLRGKMVILDLPYLPIGRHDLGVNRVKVIFRVFWKSPQLFEGPPPFSWFLVVWHVGFDLIFWWILGIFGILKSCTFDNFFTFLILMIFRVFGGFGKVVIYTWKFKGGFLEFLEF